MISVGKYNLENCIYLKVVGYENEISNYVKIENVFSAVSFCPSERRT